MKNKFRFRRWLFGRNRKNKVVKFIAKQCLKNVSHFNNEDRNQIRNGEFWLQQTLINHYNSVRSLPTIFDVGANNGEWAINILALNTNIDLHCFEPSEKTFSTLSKKLSVFPNVTLNRVGLSNKRESVDFYENDAPDVTSRYKRFNSKNKAKTKARLVKGDNYVAKKNIEAVDFLKIDIEGMEFDALQGLETCLRNNKIHFIQFEYGEFNIQSEKLLKHFYQLLPNYHLGKLFPDHVELRDWELDLENFRAANIVAINKNCTDLIKLFSN